MKIAVIGSGISGITAAHLLQRDHAVTLFEKNDYIGGHTHTITIGAGPDAGTPVDTGFIVLNDRTYPNLNRFLQSLGVPIAKSDMSFSYCDEKSGFAYASRNLSSLFAQRRNLLSPGHWSMLVEILQFNRLVKRQLTVGQLAEMTLGAFLRRHHFSRRFQQHYLFPMVAAIWSAPDLAVGRFPMLTFARFFNNHGLLSVSDHPQWYFVAGGSHRYVKAFLDRFSGDVVTGMQPVRVHRNEEGVRIETADGHTLAFDRVVIATHADAALKLLAAPSDAERCLLGAWRYSVNETFLHTDLAWMPENQRAWASWNFMRASGAGADAPVTLTYHMNRLQHLATRKQYLVTLNPYRAIDESKIVARMTYTHPVFDFHSLNTQADLPQLNGQNNTFFCGSYFGYGFHEDGARSGVDVAAALGVDHEF